MLLPTTSPTTAPSIRNTAAIAISAISVSAARALGLKVMLDIVYYHTAPDGVMMKHPEWLVHTKDGKIARRFWPQPLPDYSNPQARKYLIESLVHWVRDFKVDGFRCDVGAGVPISFWEEARKSLDQVNRDVILLSESDRPDDQLQAFDINYNFQGYLTLRSVIRDVMDYSSVENLLTESKTYFHLYSGRVSADLSAYGAVVGKRIPLAPLQPSH